MVGTPHYNNYTLGRGEVQFALFGDSVKQIPQAFRYLGDTPEFALTVATTMLDHFNSDHGIKVKDQSIPLEINRSGTVTVDVELAGALPLGARPDLSVDGTIDLDRLQDVTQVGRPATGNENSTISLFKLSADGKSATRVSVKAGKASVNSIQILEGLNPGDTVILSDMSRWDNTDRIRLE